MKGSFTPVSNRATTAPAMQVSIRQGSIAFAAAFQAAQDARYVKILVDEGQHRIAFLFTAHQGEGSFTLASDASKAKPMKIVSCPALLKAHPWLKPGKYDAAPDYRRYWIVQVTESAANS